MFVCVIEYIYIYIYATSLTCIYNVHVCMYFIGVCNVYICIVCMWLSDEACVSIPVTSALILSGGYCITSRLAFAQQGCVLLWPTSLYSCINCVFNNFVLNTIYVIYIYIQYSGSLTNVRMFTYLAMDETMHVPRLIGASLRVTVQ